MDLLEPVPTKKKVYARSETNYKSTHCTRTAGTKSCWMKKGSYLRGVEEMQRTFSSRLNQSAAGREGVEFVFPVGRQDTQWENARSIYIYIYCCILRLVVPCLRNRGVVTINFLNNKNILGFLTPIDYATETAAGAV